MKKDIKAIRRKIKADAMKRPYLNDICLIPINVTLKFPSQIYSSNNKTVLSVTLIVHK